MSDETRLEASLVSRKKKALFLLLTETVEDDTMKNMNCVLLYKCVFMCVSEEV